MDISKFPRGVPGRHLKDNIAPYATWAEPGAIARHEFWKYEQGKVIVGRIGDQLMGVNDNRHMLMVAGNRSGKSLLLTANLLEYPGSILALDFKGELSSLTARQEGPRFRQGEEWPRADVFVLDPFGVSRRRRRASILSR